MRSRVRIFDMEGEEYDSVWRAWKLGSLGLFAVFVCAMIDAARTLRRIEQARAVSPSPRDDEGLMPIETETLLAPVRKIAAWRELRSCDREYPHFPHGWSYEYNAPYPDDAGDSEQAYDCVGVAFPPGFFPDGV